jgi:very-short-patch-repair endonuclease
VRDVVYVEFATIAELDGRLGHAGAARFRDMDRDNRAAVVGEQTLRFGWHDVCAEPCRVARMVAAVLRQRGWTGVASTCRRCRLATGR